MLVKPASYAEKRKSDDTLKQEMNTCMSTLGF